MDYRLLNKKYKVIESTELNGVQHLNYVPLAKPFAC